MCKAPPEYTEKLARGVLSSLIKMKLSLHGKQNLIYSSWLGLRRELHPVEVMATPRASKVSKVESGCNRCQHACAIVSGEIS